MTTHQYTQSLTAYHRRQTISVNVGQVAIGSAHPIRVQSMTTIDTMDTEGSINQAIRMIESGCEIIRITAPSVKEAQNLENIRKGLRARGYEVPLVADIHFTPNAAELAARIVEKVRINPGNYADKKRFEIIDYTDSQYQQELDRIREKFVPLIKICKEYGTAMRIGTNHGSLSDRIMSRYGDNPLGMVESALEFLRICEEFNYDQVVISMKSSNTLVMVEAYRLLAHRLHVDGLKAYPLHLGVTEAGEGDDGRIKSAVGIGTLLEDGLGDTVRVSLTEDPEFEAPVARALVNRYEQQLSSTTPLIQSISQSPIDSFQYERRKSNEVVNFGGNNVPRVMADYSQNTIKDIDDLRPIGYYYLPAPDKWHSTDLAADYIYTGQNPVDFMLPNGLKEVIDYNVWCNIADKENKFAMVAAIDSPDAKVESTALCFVKINADDDLQTQNIDYWANRLNVVLVIQSTHPKPMLALRRLFFELIEKNIKNPVLVWQQYPSAVVDLVPLYAATDCGGLLIDGLGDGIMLSVDDKKIANNTAFGVLQAARTRMSKTEYISCPSCGRTLFDLQETTAMIRKRTDHLKGIKIGIMGCIVNGPGEMADADYGYVGIGKDKISLYRGQNVVKKSVHADNAVDELIALIQEDSRWFEPETNPIALI
jgi:(E)-4-hydroxy-3-methylbut-2-enyl-diphosphate synthase